MYLTEKLARFIVETAYESLPEPVVYQAKERIMDTLGTVIAGCGSWEYARQLKAACLALGGGHCTVAGDGRRMFSPAQAAMLNAAFAHSTELDDGHRNAGCHGGAVIVPTALAMGQELGCTGREVLTAVVIGYEVVYRIASQMSPHQIRKGFHPSSNCGVLGAMAVAGKLMKLDTAELANGLGQAAMLASGTMEATRSGQRAKCVQVGQAAYNGILAAHIAQTGMEGCLSALEGKDGLFHTQAEGVDVDRVCQGLGREYRIGDTYNKLYPACRHAHPGIEGVLELVSAHGIDYRDVAHIWIGTHQVGWELTGVIGAPKNGGEAKFSLAYAAAAALRDGSFGVAHLTPRYYTDPQLLELAGKVETVVDPEIQALYPQKRGARVSITLSGGEQWEREVFALRGSPDRPVGWAELEEKFRANTKGALPEQTADRLLGLLGELERLDTLEPMLALLD